MAQKLYLDFLDGDGKVVKSAQMLELSTKGTLETLGYHPALSTLCGKRIKRYLRLVEEEFGPVIAQLECDEMKELFRKYKNYKPDWYMLPADEKVD